MMHLKKGNTEEFMPSRNGGWRRCGVWVWVALALVAVIIVAGCLGEKKNANQGVVTQTPQKTPEIVTTNNESVISSSTGNILEKYSLEKLISMADSIVIGKVTNISPSKWNTPDGKKPPMDNTNSNIIFTDIYIQVDKYLKNPQNTEIIVVRLLGGKVGEDEQKSEDQPSYNLNENVLIFLVDDPDIRTKNIGSEHFVTLGKLQGKISILQNGGVTVGDEKMSLDELRAIITGNATKTTAVARLPI